MNTSTNVSICCETETKVLESGKYNTYDANLDEVTRDWAEVECQQCGSIYFS
jgi:hypothetical protein